jgi:hypothetical protein
MKEKIENKIDEIAHMLIVDYPQGDYMDGYVAALEWILDLMEASE